jgi:dihydroxy-acid dehydratase
LVVCGYQPSGEHRGKHVDIEDVFMGSVQAQFGKLDPLELREMANSAIRGPGVCSGMATANSMHIVVEALGMSLPGGAPVAANSAAMFDCARRSGERIVAMVWEDLRPRRILTAGAIRNAVAAVLAVSGSINCIKHLQATAVESGVDVDVFALVNELGKKIPVLSAVRPNGDDSIEAFDAAGGARAVLKQLERFLDLDALTVTGKTLGENLAGFAVRDEGVIRPVTRPFSDRPPIVVLRGSLAPDSAIVKLGLRDPSRKDRFSGSAIVFDDGFDAIKAIKEGAVQAGHVLVVRGMGPKGGPGMAGPASMVVFALYSASLENDVAFVTDGQLSGLCNKGLTVAEVSPEAATGGPLALVESGDTIAVDVNRGRLDLEVDEATLAARRAKLGTPALKSATGWLSIYQKQVQPMSKGVVLVKGP